MCIRDSIFIRLAFKKHLMYFFTGCKRQNIGILCPCNQMFQCCDISGNGFSVKAKKCGSRICILFHGGQVIASCIKAVSYTHLLGAWFWDEYYLTDIYRLSYWHLLINPDGNSVFFSISYFIKEIKKDFSF